MKTQSRKPRGMPESVVQGVRLLGRVSGRVSVVYFSQKAGGFIPLESPTEKTVAQLADLDPRIVRLQAQPFTLDVLTGTIYETREELLLGRQTREKNDVKVREYTPDFLLITLDGRRIVVEVKAEQFPGPEEYQLKLAQAKKILDANGYEFILVTLQHAPNFPITQNADLLTSFARNYRGTLSADQIAYAEELLEIGPRELGTVCQEIKLSLREAPALILTGVVSLDLTVSRLNVASQVACAYGDLAHLAILPL